MSKGGSSLKLDNDLEKRQAESLRIMEKYPDRIHVIVDKAEKFEIPNIDKKKYLSDLINSWSICVCDSQKNQTKFRESYLHIRRQCPSSYRRDSVKRLRRGER
ncbi:autophagy-related protein 8e [Brassica napus]|uniref:autophagy-related protein 8e n=1 Tax=Brassica napus TaxID=3708 RepID=UPI0006AB5885|nr:autophagy-related protein 8e [Brassica napus]XP_022557316.1 autophagy-related protein 8e [Brassica napus]XP_048611257.1 autophagy-related protein 8e [Brassica napus]